MTQCRSCGAPIEWAKTAAGKPIPLDPPLAPDNPLKARANVRIAGRLTDGTAVIVVVGHGEGTHVTHFATCPNAGTHRKLPPRTAGFNASESRSAAAEGIERADESADPDWKARADDAIERVARMMPEFTSDDVWEHGGLGGTRENRALGPRMRSAAQRGIITATENFRPTRQVKSHSSPARVWRSLIYQGSLL